MPCFISARARWSPAQPCDYHANNVVGTLNLLEAMRRLVFSSSSVVFGQPVADLDDEGHADWPINPYGASKLMVERIVAVAAGNYAGYGGAALFQRGWRDGRCAHLQVASLRDPLHFQCAVFGAEERTCAEDIRRQLLNARRHLHASGHRRRICRDCSHRALGDGAAPCRRSGGAGRFKRPGEGGTGLVAGVDQSGGHY